MMNRMNGWFVKSLVSTCLLMVTADAALIRLDASEGVFAIVFIGVGFVGAILMNHWRDASRGHPS